MRRPVGPPPDIRRAPAPRVPAATVESSKRPSMDVQSLLFGCDAGWTVERAKAWAKAHGYRFVKIHVTDQYIRIRQFDPKGTSVKRTITLGRGIRAVVAREESMATSTKEARRRRPGRKSAKRVKSTKEAAARKPRRRRAREEAWHGDSAGHRKAAKKGAAKRRRRRSAREAPVAAEARRARPRRRRARAAGQMMEASRRRRPRRRPRRAREESWRNNPAGHRKAAKKGWAKRRRSRKTREQPMREAPRRRRRRSSGDDQYMMESRRPRRRGSRRRRSGMFEARRGSSGRAMYGAELALAVVAGGLGFVLADGIDRWLATYDPAATGAKPTDKFTSDGAGTLANTLNVASSPNFLRLAAGVGATAVPAVASFFVENPFIRSSLEGAAIGAGVNLFRMFWANVLMPMLKPKDTSTASLQKSIIARLYPAEVAASINLAQTPPTQSASGVAFGALSGAQQAQQPAPGVGAPPDVGPFALAAESPYPDTVQALRRQAGVQGPAYPSSQEVWGTGNSTPGWPGVGDQSPYPSAHDALQQQAGLGDIFSDVANAVAQLAPDFAHAASQVAANVVAAPHDIAGAIHRAVPQAPVQRIHELARHIHSHVARRHARPAPPRVRPRAPGVSDYDTGVGADFNAIADAVTNVVPGITPQTAAQTAARAVAEPHDLVGAIQRGLPHVHIYMIHEIARQVHPHVARMHAGTQPAAPVVPSASPAPAVPPAPMMSTTPLPPQPATGVSQGYTPGPPTTPGPGPTAHQPEFVDKDCACLGDDNQFLGFIGDAEEKDMLFNDSKAA